MIARHLHGCTGRWGTTRAARFAVGHLSGFEFFLLPSRIHARRSAMLRERKPLGELMGNPGSDKSVRMMQVMPKMKKIIVADLQKACNCR